MHHNAAFSYSATLVGFDSFQETPSLSLGRHTAASMALADVLQKSVSAFLGGVTLITGVWIGSTFFSMYYQSRQVRSRWPARLQRHLGTVATSA
jgi:hypothetical protein